MVHPEHGPGFDLWVGGGLSTNPMLGQRLGAWVPLDEVPDVWAGVVSIFRDYGYRRLRNRARLKFLVADWGVGEVPRGAGDRVPQADADRRPGARAARPGRATTSACTRRRTAGSTSGSTRPSAGCPATLLTKLADLVAEAHGSDRIRMTTDQGLVILDIDRATGSTSLVAGLDELGLSVNPSTFRRNMMACTGLEFCKLAIVETKARGIALVDELEKRHRRPATCRSPSTSTAARTPAPAPRSPTSASRA